MRGGQESGTVYPSTEADHAAAAAPAAAPAPGDDPCPSCLPHAQGRAAPADSWSSIRHSHTVPDDSVYPSTLVSALHTAHTLAQATPKTIHQSRYQTKTDQASSRFLSLTDASPPEDSERSGEPGVASA